MQQACAVPPEDDSSPASGSFLDLSPDRAQPGSDNEANSGGGGGSGGDDREYTLNAALLQAAGTECQTQVVGSQSVMGLDRVP